MRLEHRNLYENQKWLFPSILALFWCIFLLIHLVKIIVYTCNIFSCVSMKLYHEQYKVQWCDKCETVLRVLFLNTDDLFLGQEYWYTDICHSTAIHISSAEVHDQTEDMCILQPLPYRMLWHKYDAHVASLYFYMFHIFDVIFHQTFCFEHFGFDLLVFLNNYHSRIAMMNVYF